MDHIPNPMRIIILVPRTLCVQKEYFSAFPYSLGTADSKVILALLQGQQIPTSTGLTLPLPACPSPTHPLYTHSGRLRHLARVVFVSLQGSLLTDLCTGHNLRLSEKSENFFFIILKRKLDVHWIVMTQCSK